MIPATEARHRTECGALPRFPIRTMEPFGPNSPTKAEMSWRIHGDPAVLVDAARRLRLGVEVGTYRSQPPGEYAMFGLARLLDSIAFSMHVDGAVHHNVVSGAMEIANHVLNNLLPVRPARCAPQVTGRQSASCAGPRG